MGRLRGSEISIDKAIGNQIYGFIALLFSIMNAVNIFNRKEVFYTKNDITDWLDINDKESEIVDSGITGNIKYITVRKKLTEKYCPLCGSRMHSHGQFTRHPNNQVLADGYIVKLTVIGRNWECSNDDCSYTCRDEFPFLDKNKKNTKIMPLLIINAMKDLHLTCRQVAERFNVSDTYVHDIFTAYVDLPRLPLTEFISIDEVYVNMAPDMKYALIIMDFTSGTILDILPSRRKQYTEEYFYHIPLEERDKVKYLICDMYNPYINYTVSFFHNAQAVVDSFHVVQWLLRLINNYINDVKKKYQARDRKKLTEDNKQRNREFEKQKDSKEVYILKHAKWVLLQNAENDQYYPPRFNNFLGRVMDTISWKTEFMKLDSSFSEIKLEKDLYEDFNSHYLNDPENARKALDELIEFYAQSDLEIFRKFSRLLKNYHDQIINSFVALPVSSNEKYPSRLRRLSNGPMESFNNKPSQLRTDSHGISNFDFYRNRILWSLRDDASILAVPKPAKLVKSYPGKKRGKYNK